jgi:exopolysaccharide biosynthesis polyprenyl glycosylphosphotransferase
MSTVEATGPSSGSGDAERGGARSHALRVVADAVARADEPRRSPNRTKAAVVVADLVAVCVALLMATAAWNITFGVGDNALGRYFAISALSIPFWFGAFAWKRLYAARFFLRVADEFRRVVAAATGAVLALAIVAYIVDEDLARGWLLLAWAHATVLLLADRTLVRLYFRRQRRSGRMARPVVIVGLNLEGLELYRSLQENPALGYMPVGFVDDDPSTAIPGLEILGDVRHTVDLVREVGAQGVIIAATALDLDTSNRLIRELTDAGIHVQLSSTLRDIASYRLTVQPLGRFPVVYVEPVVRGGWRRSAKRAFDLVASITALVVASPALAICAVAIKLDSPGPVLFRQKRVGRDGQEFEVLKFRTMVVDAEDRLAELQELNESDGPLFKMRHDPRITRVGRFLRKTSLDELPQFWNVVRDDMSIVGPRPALASEMEVWEPELFHRLRVKPGITGMWQVHGRSSASFAEYVRLDLYYVDNWSLVNDLAIVAKTVPAVLLRRGAM